MIKHFKSKWHFISVGIGIIPSIIDWYQIIQQIAVYWMLIVSVLLLLLIFLFFSQSKNSDTSSTKVIVADAIQDKSIGGQNLTENDLIQPKKGGGFLLKVISFLFLLVLMLSLSSMLYLKYKPIYYIRIENKNTVEAADKLITSINKKLNNAGLNDYSAVRKRRSVNEIKNNHMVCINGGYLSENEAIQDLAVLKDVLREYKNIEVKGSVGTSLFRKVAYLRTHANRKMNRLVQVAK